MVDIHTTIFFLGGGVVYSSDFIQLIRVSQIQYGPTTIRIVSLTALLSLNSPSLDNNGLMTGLCKSTSKYTRTTVSGA